MWVKKDAWLHVHVSREVEPPRGIHGGVEHAREHAWLSGFGFRVSGFGFRVSGFGFRVSGSVLRVSCCGLLFSCLGSRVWKLEFRL